MKKQPEKVNKWKKLDEGAAEIRRLQKEGGTKFIKQAYFDTVYPKQKSTKRKSPLVRAKKGLVREK